MNRHKTLSGPSAFRLFLIASMACALGAWQPAGHAQPTGNPKGTASPPASGASAKPTPNRTQRDDSSPRLDERLGPAEARKNQPTPTGGGTAGGLTRKNPAEADPSRNSQQPDSPTRPPSGGTSR